MHFIQDRSHDQFAPQAHHVLDTKFHVVLVSEGCFSRIVVDLVHHKGTPICARFGERCCEKAGMRKFYNNLEKSCNGRPIALADIWGCSHLS
jgi:hypothetical protein